MAEPNESTPPATGTETPAETPPAQTPPPSDDAQLGDAGKRAIQAERDARKAAEKRATEAEKRAQEYEDRDKSETEKLAGQATREKSRADTAEAERDEARGELLRLQVALEKGIPSEAIDRLKGSTREELEADADALSALLGGGEGGATPPGSFDGGAQTPPPQKNLDEQIAEAEKAGDWKAVDRLNAIKLAQIATA